MTQDVGLVLFELRYICTQPEMLLQSTSELSIANEPEKIFVSRGDVPEPEAGKGVEFCDHVYNTSCHIPARDLESLELVLAGENKGKFKSP